RRFPERVGVVAPGITAAAVGRTRSASNVTASENGRRPPAVLVPRRSRLPRNGPVGPFPGSGGAESAGAVDRSDGFPAMIESSPLIVPAETANLVEILLRNGRKRDVS